MLKHANQMNAAPLQLLEHFGAPVVPNESHPPVNGEVAPELVSKNVRILAAGLKRLSADCEYDLWLRMGAIAFNVSGGTQEGFDCFAAWSSTGKKYKGTRDIRAKWKSFRLDHPRPLTMASFRFILEGMGHDWLEICAEADGDDFRVEMGGNDV